MSYIAVDKSGEEWVFVDPPVRNEAVWYSKDSECGEDLVQVPIGTAKALLGIDLTWEDEPVKLPKELE